MKYCDSSNRLCEIPLVSNWEKNVNHTAIFIKKINRRYPPFPPSTKQLPWIVLRDTPITTLCKKNYRGSFYKIPPLSPSTKKTTRFTLYPHSHSSQNKLPWIILLDTHIPTFYKKNNRESLKMVPPFPPSTKNPPFYIVPPTSWT